MNKKYLYGLSALMLVSGMATMTSCQSEEDLIGGGQKVMLTISADKQDEATRTQFTPSGKGLNSVWTAGDQLLITTHSGIAGVVTLSSGAGTASGVFKGEVTLSDNGEDEIALFYLGKGVNPADVKDPKYTIDLSSQTDNLEGLAEKDFLATTCFVKYMNGTANASVEMNRYVDEAYFTLELPDGLTLGEGDVVTISGDNMTVGRAITLSKTSGDVWGWDNTAANQVTGSITVTKTSEMGNALYFTMHGNQTVAPTFTVTKDGYRYIATMSTAHTWNGSQFVNNNGEPIAVTDWTKEKETLNPGDTSNWGGENQGVDADQLTIQLLSKADGWTLNVSTTYGESYGGFGQYIRYNQNGIINGMLTSKVGTRVDNSAIFYQWGRWLGFPYCANWIYLIPEGDGEIYSPDGKIYTEMLPHGVNYYETKIGYSWWNSVSGAYVSAYMGANSSWTKERAKNCAICYGLGNSLSGHLDYVYANENCTWEERGGNPAPDNYAIPTVKQLEALMPNGTISSNTVQFKTINGKRYAMRWKVTNVNVGGSSTLPSVEVRSFETNEANVSANDTRFNSANAVNLTTFGYLDNSGDLQQKGSRGYFWSNESGANTLTNTSGNGGKALYVYINGSSITMGIAVLPRTFAANVLLVKEEGKKSDSITPWFPLTGVGTPHW